VAHRVQKTIRRLGMGVCVCACGRIIDCNGGHLCDLCEISNDIKERNEAQYKSPDPVPSN
jgi:hypothetical protein